MKTIKKYYSDQARIAIALPGHGCFQGGGYKKTPLGGSFPRPMRNSEKIISLFAANQYILINCTGDTVLS